MPGLSDAVRAYRLNAMRDFMRRHGYDALAFTGGDWVEWAGNHPVRESSAERPYLFVVPLEGQSIAFFAEIGQSLIEMERRQGLLWIDKVIYYVESPMAQPKSWISTQWRDMVAQELSAAGLHQARIGVDAISGALAKAAALMPGLSLTPVQSELKSLRWVKHPEEIATMRKAAALSDWTIDCYRAEIKPGRLVCELDHYVSSRLASQAADAVPDQNYAILRLTTLSGASASCPLGDISPNGRRIQKDSVALTTIATKLNGLVVELTRTFLIGSPPGSLIGMFDCALSAQEAGIAAAVAGRPARGIHEAAQDVIARAGFRDHLPIRGGHGIGVIMHDFPEDLPFVDRPLQNNETYAIEPGVYDMAIGGCRFSDTIVVGREGAESLTRATKQRSELTIN